MDEEIKEKLSNTETWIRGIYIILFLLILGLTKFIIGALVLFQFLSSLITGSTNERLVEFGQSLAAYVSQVVLYLCYSTNDKPYPFSDWPAAKTTAAPRKRSRKKSARKSATDTSSSADSEPEEKPTQQ